MAAALAVTRPQQVTPLGVPPQGSLLHQGCTWGVPVPGPPAKPSRSGAAATSAAISGRARPPPAHRGDTEGAGLCTPVFLWPPQCPPARAKDTVSPPPMGTSLRAGCHPPRAPRAANGHERRPCVTVSPVQAPWGAPQLGHPHKHRCHPFGLSPSHRGRFIAWGTLRQTSPQKTRSSHQGDAAPPCVSPPRLPALLLPRGTRCRGTSGPGDTVAPSLSCRQPPETPPPR